MEEKASKNMQPLPVGIQTFRDLRAGNFLYVDKTEQIYLYLCIQVKWNKRRSTSSDQRKKVLREIYFLRETYLFSGSGISG